MKRKSVIRKLLIMAGCATLFSAVDVGVAWCANSVSASTSGTVIAPISITKDTDLQFGKFLAGPVGGTVVVLPAGTRDFTGDTVLFAGIAPTAATFTVTGETGTTYSVTLPGSIVLTSGSNTMTVGSFTSTPLAAAGSLAAGTESLKVGATVTVGASQAAGLYTNPAGLTVLVNYN